MNKTKLIPIIVLMVLLVPLAVAVPINTVYEKAAVGRIIGDTPEEMEDQLAMDNLDLEIYQEMGNVISGLGHYDSPMSALLEKFGSNNVGYEMRDADSNYIDMVTSGWTKKPMLVLKWKNGLTTNGEVLYSPGSLITPAFLNEYQTASQFTSGWKTGFANKNPLLFMNSEYSGLYDKNSNNLLKEIGQDAVTIAPMFYSSKIFPSSFGCSLGKYTTLGQTFTHARNHYYHRLSDHKEYLGLTLLSYTLYGDPTLMISVPSYNEARNDELCTSFRTPLDAYDDQRYIVEFNGEQEELDFEFDIDSMEDPNSTTVVGYIDMDSDSNVIHATMQVGLE
jgi:hypothetical protein